MTTERIQNTTRHLYEGVHHPIDMPLSASLQFKDPLVIVSGRTRVLRMFRRLNALFPASTLKTFVPIEGQSEQFQLCTHYRRTPQSPPHVFETIMELKVVDGEITAITEHWKSPITLHGNSTNPAARFFRRGLGRLLS